MTMTAMTSPINARVAVDRRSNAYQLKVYGATTAVGITVGAVAASAIARANHAHVGVSALGGAAAGGLLAVIGATYLLLAIQD